MVIVGIDEVGRGCWAGPLVAGAVVLSKPTKGLRDSKQLSKAQREKLSLIIENEALAISLGWVTPSEIDELGLTESVRLAMHRALKEIRVNYDQIIIDGNFNYLNGNPKAVAMVKADSKIPAVSAASIVAKVARDRYMTEVAKQYPVYGFDRHVGYGTALHVEKLRLHGVSEVHRKSFKPIADLLQLAA